LKTTGYQTYKRSEESQSIIQIISYNSLLGGLGPIYNYMSL